MEHDVTQDPSEVFYSLLGRPLNAAEMETVRTALADTQVYLRCVIEALHSLKSPEVVSKLKEASQLVTEKVYGEALRENGDAWQAGFVTGTLHGVAMSALANEHADGADTTKVAAAMYSLLMIAVGKVTAGEQWPEEISDEG